MTGWGKYAGAALALGLLGGCAQAAPLSAADCRRVWDGVAQTQGENGSIAPEGTATEKRWKQEYDEARRRADEPGDLDSCAQDVVEAGTRFAALVDVGAAIQRYDLAAQLERAELDLEHAQDLGSFTDPPPPLEQAFADLREAAPEVHEAVTEAESAVTDVDLEDKGKVEDLVDEIKDAATGSPAYDKGREALETIGRYELDEE